MISQSTVQLQCSLTRRSSPRLQVRSGRQLAAGQILVVVCLVVTTFLLEPMMAGIWLKRHDALVVPPPLVAA